MRATLAGLAALVALSAGSVVATEPVTLDQALSKGARVGCIIDDGLRLSRCTPYGEATTYPADVRQALMERAAATDARYLAGLKPGDRLYVDVGREAEWERPDELFHGRGRDARRSRVMGVRSLYPRIQPMTAPSPPDGLIREPVWSRRPDPSKMASLFPVAARDMEAAGYVLVECRVSPDGELGDCKVLAETPTGYGFGTASLELAPYFQVSTAGRTLGPGAVIWLPINWRFG